MDAPRRTYASPLRTAQAEQTRERVLRAAAAQFAAHGYAGTSLGSIAAQAGVAVGTVKLTGAKHELLLAAFELVFSGRESRDPIMSERSAQELVEATPTDQLPELVAAVAAELNARAATLWTAVTAAANTDDAVRQAVDDLLERRRADFRLIVAAFDDRGLVADGADRAELAAILSFLASPEGYRQLVHESGLSPDRYKQWLARAIRQVVIDQPPAG